MQGSDFDEGEFFRAISASGSRALLIGRRALIALGIPLLTADYDFWKAHFGESAGSGSSTLGAVPEPAASVMFLVGTLALLYRRRVPVSYSHAFCRSCR